MRSLRPLLSLVVALVLLAQTGLAAAHCLAIATAGGHLTEICSPDGVRVIRIAADGAVLDDAPRHDEAGFCAACPTPVAAAVESSRVVPVPVTWTPAPSPALTTPAALRPRARAPPYASRAPPLPA